MTYKLLDGRIVEDENDERLTIKIRMVTRMKRRLRGRIITSTIKCHGGNNNILTSRGKRGRHALGGQ